MSDTPQSTMSPEAQRVALAEWAGWKMFPAGKDSFGVFCEAHATREHEAILQSKLPDYLNDLNAVHDVEHRLEAHQLPLYMSHLNALVSHQNLAVDGMLWHATAAKRCDALCHTLGLWKEGV